MVRCVLAWSKLHSLLAAARYIVAPCDPYREHGTERPRQGGLCKKCAGTWIDRPSKPTSHPAIQPTAIQPTDQPLPPLLSPTTLAWRGPGKLRAVVPDSGPWALRPSPRHMLCSASSCLLPLALPRRISLRDNLLSDDVEAQPSLSAWSLSG
ncbi:hypothetical protein F5883DRAFT_219630 [Diaporthe sp. PMI_573]|nr:hypothetical protein F5883DRAFT_219630 [Diaporthaceae sp. PMI_573]